MQITIDTTTLTDADRAFLLGLLGEGTVSAPEKASTPAPKATAPAAKKAASKPAPKPAPEPEDEDTDEPDNSATLADAVKAATALVSAGKAATVKAALKAVGAARVSEVDEDKVSEFLELLDI